MSQQLLAQGGIGFGGSGFFGVVSGFGSGAGAGSGFGVGSDVSGVSAADRSARNFKDSAGLKSLAVPIKRPSTTITAFPESE